MAGSKREIKRHVDHVFRIRKRTGDARYRSALFNVPSHLRQRVEAEAENLWRKQKR